MAYTLAQLAKIEKQAFKKGVLLNILRHAKVMETLPWENVNSLTSLALRLRTLPGGIAFRQVGGAYTEQTNADVEQVWESVYGFGGELLFDRVFDKVSNTVVDPKVFQTEMKLKRLSFDWNNYFINGDHANDPDGFEGLMKRVSLMPARQTVWFAANNAGALDPTTNVASARAFLDNWDMCWHRCNGGQPSAMFMNEGTYLGFGKVMRYVNISGGSLLDVTKDSFERQILTYKGVPMYDMGLLADQATEIITETEVAGDGAADATSVYFVSFGTDEGLTGIQLSDLETYDPNGGGEMSTQPAKQTRIEWWCGLASFGSYGIVRGRNFEGAAGWT